MANPRQAWRISVSESPIDVQQLTARTVTPASGAIVLFLGTVRDHSPGKTGITHLEYEAYREHVEQKISEIVEEADRRWDLHSAAVEHRVGTVEVGEASVGVAVATAHRAEAFEAARYIIDQLKLRAPIWKKEHWPGGGEWVEGA